MKSLIKICFLPPFLTQTTYNPRASPTIFYKGADSNEANDSTLFDSLTLEKESTETFIADYSTETLSVVYSTVLSTENKTRIHSELRETTLYALYSTPTKTSLITTSVTDKYTETTAAGELSDISVEEDNGNTTVLGGALGGGAAALVFIAGIAFFFVHRRRKDIAVKTGGTLSDNNFNSVT